MKVREMIRLLEANGWEMKRVSGDHRIFKKDSVAKAISVPGKLSSDMPDGLQYSILRDAGLKKINK